MTGIKLTPREREIVEALIDGGPSNKIIAARLGITEGTIKEYLFRLFRKTGTSNRTELVVKVLTNPDSIDELKDSRMGAD